MKKPTRFAKAILLVGCASSKIVLTDPESANYKYGKSKFTGYSKELFVQGKTIHANSCLKCHKQKDSFKFTEEQLKKIIPNMAKMAKITDEELKVHLYYILLNQGVPHCYSKSTCIYACYTLSLPLIGANRVVRLCHANLLLTHPLPFLYPYGL